MKKNYSSPQVQVYPLGAVDTILMTSTTSFDGYLETPQDMDILDDNVLITTQGEIG